VTAAVPVKGRLTHDGAGLAVARDVRPV